MKKATSLKLSFLFVGLTIIFFLQESVSAQATITLGAQSIYDDNIFLENGKDRPAPTTSNNQLEDSLPNGFFNLENFDGEENEDIITNVFAQISGKLPFLRKTFDSNYDLRTGAIIFADYSSQDRITVDGQLTNSLSENILPRPYYFNIRNAIQSNSNNLAAASGTATQATQNYLIATDLGARDVELSRDTRFDLGYSGGYQIFLGQFYINEDLENENTKQQGTDYHSHTAITALKHQLTKRLEIGALGSGGVQLFTKIHDGAFSNQNLDPEDLDRTNAQLLGTSRYVLSREFVLNGNGGLAFSKLHNSPEPRTVTVFEEDGTTSESIIQSDGSNTGLTYTISLDYAYRPGALATIGSTQGFATNLDGQRFLTRLFYANVIESITNDLKLTLGTRYIQLEDESDTRPNTDRFEGSISLNYHVTENLSLNCGYNYADQTADKSGISEDLRFASPEYTSNRFFVGISTGFVGLPL